MPTGSYSAWNFIIQENVDWEHFKLWRLFADSIECFYRLLSCHLVTIDAELAYLLSIYSAKHWFIEREKVLSAFFTANGQEKEETIRLLLIFSTQHNMAGLKKIKLFQNYTPTQFRNIHSFMIF